jgi:dTDP-4-amino-4,6-dideoxygalactose transaminase
VGQLETAKNIVEMRLATWQRYHDELEPLQSRDGITCPFIPEEYETNGHMYYVILPGDIDRQALIQLLLRRGIQTVFHYVPLHDSVAGLKFGHCARNLNITESMSRRILRLPLWVGITEQQQSIVVNALSETISTLRPHPQLKALAQ